jgi:hypothetical protein
MPTSATLQTMISPATSGYATKLEGLAFGWKLILISIPIAIVLAIFVMILIRCLASVFIYALIFLLVGILITFGVYVWTQPVGGAVGTTSLFQNSAARAIVSIISFLLAFAVVLFVCCYRSRIRLASKIVEVSAVYVAKNCFILVVPLVMFVTTLALLALWVVEALGYYSLGTPVACSPQCLPFQHFNLPNTVYALMVLHIFFLLWFIFFMIHTNEFLITGSASSWYYSQESPLYSTMHRYFGKHMGSVCVGSFLVALVGFIKLVYTMLAPDPTI